ncbi:MAG: transporter associated domain-containing protein, partial [Pseudomonadota bacterium]
KQLADDRWEAHARIPLEDLSAGTGFNFEVEELEADTVGGLVFSLAGRVPLRGEVISHPKGPQFEICDADARRIRRVIIRLQETLPETLIDNEMASDDGPETVTSPEGRQVNRQGLKKGSRDRATPEQNIDNAGPQG